MDPQLFKIIAVEQPKSINDLFCVLITLQNIKGEQKQEKRVFNNITVAWDFYKTQLLTLKNNKSL